MQRLKVLVVEDEIVTRRYLCAALSKALCVTVQASTGVRALHLLEDNSDFDLILCDIGLPDIDGRELIPLIRSGPGRDTPLVVISGIIGPKEINSLLEIGADRFLPKPVDLRLLRDVLTLPQRKKESSQTSVPL